MNPTPEFHAVDATHRADLKAAIKAMPASRLLGVQVIGFSPAGASRIEMPIRPELTFDGRVVQGGIVGVLADYAGVLADYAGVSAVACTLKAGWIASTTGFEVHNIAPAMGQRLVAVGQAASVGKSIGVSRAEVYVESAGHWTLVCVATTTCKPIDLSAGKAR